jgi:hypothetical protein
MSRFLRLALLAAAAATTARGAGVVSSVVELDRWRTHRFPPVGARPRGGADDDDPAALPPLLQLRLSLESISGDADLYVAGCDEPPPRVAAGEYLGYSFTHGTDAVLLDLYSAEGESAFWETTCAFVLGKSENPARYLLALHVVERYTDTVVRDLALEGDDETSWFDNGAGSGPTTGAAGSMTWLEVASKVFFFVLELLA